MSQSNDPLLTDADALQAALDKCASEPVHIPGLVQPLGGLLALDRAALTVGYASENLDRVLGANLRQRLFWGRGRRRCCPRIFWRRFRPQRRGVVWRSGAQTSAALPSVHSRSKLRGMPAAIFWCWSWNRRTTPKTPNQRRR